MPGFWNAGLGLFVEAEHLVSGSSEKKHLQSCISQAREQLTEVQNESQNTTSTENGSNRRFLFEGHLTVDPEPEQPAWLELSSQGDPANVNTTEGARSVLEELVARLDDIIPEMLDDGPAAPRAPPASKQVVANLPVITVTDEFLMKLVADAECAICREVLVVDDKMQELPCKHMFHPPCLKPWLDEHNSCPICRHELLTDDHHYENWKEREKEAEEERKGAANAVREGEYILDLEEKLRCLIHELSLASC
ncbi:E3 ubiquitin-protein ligase AIP2 [Capsicum annuum]|nr:E3 ubiquitin-protein ligase AIP2 [Capsicum annuum]